MKDGAVLANAGHFDVEVDMACLNRLSEGKEVRENIRQYEVFGKKLNVVGEGRLANLAAGDGHPIEIMDMSFSMQALGAIHLKENYKVMQGLSDIPYEAEQLAARIKMKSIGVTVDTLTPEQRNYLYGEE